MLAEQPRFTWRLRRLWGILTKQMQELSKGTKHFKRKVMNTGWIFLVFLWSMVPNFHIGPQNQGKNSWVNLTYLHLWTWKLRMRVTSQGSNTTQLWVLFTQIFTQNWHSDWLFSYLFWWFWLLFFNFSSAGWNTWSSLIFKNKSICF